MVLAWAPLPWSPEFINRPLLQCRLGPLWSICYARKLIAIFAAGEKPSTQCLSCVSTSEVTSRKAVVCYIFPTDAGGRRVTGIRTSKNLLSKFPSRKWTHKISVADLFVQPFEVFNIHLGSKSAAPPLFTDIIRLHSRHTMGMLGEGVMPDAGSGSAHLSVVYGCCFCRHPTSTLRVL